MNVIGCRNVNHALELGINAVVRGLENGHVEKCDSRNGPVYRFVYPVTTVYEKPWEKVLFNPARDCNPFFHLIEAMWMLGGKRDVKSVAHFVKRMSSFSDDGEVFNGAYGFRWRHWWGFDQISECIQELKTNPSSRRIVMSMWSPVGDMVEGPDGYGGPSSKDLPCNMMIKFAVDNNRNLNMMVFNRSNDMIWGAYGANAVHMAFLQEYVAFAAGLNIGRYYQISCDFHVYENVYNDLMEKLKMSPEGTWSNRYEKREYRITPLIGGGEHFTDTDSDCDVLFNRDFDEMKYIDIREFDTAFFRFTVVPMFNAHMAYKKGDRLMALTKTGEIECEDWREAAREWILRRAK